MRATLLHLAVVAMGAIAGCAAQHPVALTGDLRVVQLPAEKWPPQVDIGEEAGAARLAEFGATWSDAESWRRRADTLRAQILVALDLQRIRPFSDRGAATVRRGPAREHDGYTVENVAFESEPGVRVCGNLYLPTGRRGQFPAVLCPHGHFQPNGDDPEGRFRRDMQIRCATLARMGAAVFAWDMAGWGEDRAREHATPESSRIQTLNAIRVVDFMQSLPEVDDDRIGVTGASGGGTQSFILACVDRRVTCCVPTVMVSAHFFGGCPCESGLRIHDALGERTCNAELAAAVAPRALLLISCGGDWTRNTPEVEFPYAQRVYEALGAPQNVANAHFADEGHDYGATKRAPMYRFMARHLGLDLAPVTNLDGTFAEDVTIEPRAVLCVDG